MSANKTIHVIEHWPLAEPDAGRRHLIARGFDVQVHEPWKGDDLPTLTGAEAGVMVMGGPQMVSEHETWPYLANEFRFIEQALQHEVPLMGICLGSQMIAHVLGARVGYRSDRRMAMGFYELDVTPQGESLIPQSMKALSGNSQGWTLPHGATLLAKGDESLFPNQAFSYGDQVLGLQFHPEVTRAILSQWQTEFASSIGRPGTHSKAQQDAGFDAHDAALKDWYRALLDRWFAADQTQRAV